MTITAPALPILSADTWATNADLIADAARLGLVESPAIDMTYGQGGFWAKHRPDHLETNDLYAPADHALDWTRPLPWDMHRRYRTVVFDPPYRLNGTPDLGKFDERYGTGRPMPVSERLRRLRVGARNCSQLVADGGTLLVKCQDQVANGQMHWQTLMVHDMLDPERFTLDARFHLIGGARKQRSQKRARNNFSTLLVYRADGRGRLPE